MSDEEESGSQDPFEGEFYDTKCSKKTHAITVVFKSIDAFSVVENALHDRYSFRNNKNCNGLEARLLDSGHKVVLTLYKNQTLLIQGKGCRSWRDKVFRLICNSLNVISEKSGVLDDKTDPSRSSGTTLRSECENSHSTPKSKSPIFYLSRMVSSVRASRHRNKPLPVYKTNTTSATMSTPKSSKFKSLLDNGKASPSGDQTFVKTLFSSNNEDSVPSPVDSPCVDNNGIPPESTRVSSDDTSFQLNASELALHQQQRENKELQESLKDLLSQSKLLKSENESLVKLVENKTSEIKVLRDKCDDVSSKLEKTENALSHTKVELTKATAQSLIFEENVTKMKKQNEILTKEKSGLVDKLMKVNGSTDSVEAKIEESSEKLEVKFVNEINELKKELVKELKELKDQIIKSKAVTCNTNNNKPVASNPNQNPSVISNCRENIQSRVASNIHQSAFIAGDSMTRILSTAKMRDKKLDVKVKSHPGGRIRTIENCFINLSESDPEYLKQLDAIVLHVGTNNVSDAMSCESITEELRDTIFTIQSVNSKVKIIISSIIPRCDDKVVNDIIKKTNSSLHSLCEEKGHFFLNNDDGFLLQNVPNRFLYRDNIHLNAKGGRVLGMSMRDALDRVLGTVPPSDVQSVYQGGSNFYNGRRPGRSPVHSNNMSMAYMPVQRQWLNHRNPWSY